MLFQKDDFPVDMTYWKLQRLYQQCLFIKIYESSQANKITISTVEIVTDLTAI